MRFVVCVDDSEQARKAFNYAVELAGVDSTVLVVHIVECPKPSIFDPLHDKLDNLQALEAREQGERISQHFSPLMSRFRVRIPLHFVMSLSTDVLSPLHTCYSS
jgi:hypothetical protein